MSVDRIRRYYDRTAPVYDLTRRPFLLGRDLGVAALDLTPGLSVAEIGAGTGRNLRPILDGIGRGTLALVDISTPMLRRARARLRDGDRVLTVAADARAFPFSGRFDRVLFSYSLSLLPDPPGILRAARALLNPGGCVAVVDFGPMARWGPARGVIRAWLALHSVRPVLEHLEAVPGADLSTCHGGYTILARIPPL